VKTLVLYDSRHGFTDRCVDHLAGFLPPGADPWPVRRRPGTPVWADYDAIVIGGPVYFGKWSPALVRFLKRHAAPIRRHRPVAAFVVSLSPKAAALGYLEAGLPPALAGHPGFVGCFGGNVTWRSLSWWERLLLKADRGIETDVGNLDLGEIQALASWLTAKASPE